MTIGEKIKFCRIEKGLSQKDLASSISVDVSFICKVEKNEKSLTLEKLVNLSEILEEDCIEFKHIYYADKIFEFLNSEDKNFIKNLLLETLNKITE